MKKQIIKSGLPGLDRLLHGLLPGDNVVLKVGSIEDYLPFVEPFCQASVEQRIPLVYFRFARHKARKSKMLACWEKSLPCTKA